MTCVFFGHRDAPPTFCATLRKTIEELVHEGVTTFYVGHQGNFDLMVRQEFYRVKENDQHIDCVVVLAYPPFCCKQSWELETLYPCGLENKPRRYAMEHRNKWMLEKADVVVAYVERKWGVTVQNVERARRKGIRVVLLPREM